MEALGVSSRALWIFLLATLLFSSRAVVRGQNMQVMQHPESVLVAARKSLTLNCTLTVANVPGGVRWNKAQNGRQTPIYSDKGESSPRWERVNPGSNSDFSINIRSILPEDAGTYFCVKFRAGISERALASGKGTVVSVVARPSQPLLRGPPGRVTVGSRASFNCSTEGFSPREITVLWLKDGTRIEDAQTRILGSADDQSNSYRVESAVEVLLGRGDVRSQLTCQIHHSSLEAPLQQDFQLGSILRVPPSLRLDTSPPSPVQLNASVTVTCSAEEFYPDDANVELFAKDSPGLKGKVEPRAMNSDGTSSLKSHLEVTATEDKNLSMFVCLVEHHSQPPVNKTTTLFVAMQVEGSGRSGGDSLNGQTNILIIAVVVCVLLVALVIAVIYLIQARHKKGKDSTSARLHESEKPPGLVNQDPDPNNLNYADLNFDKDAQKRPRQVAESPLQSEYATLQAVQPVANDDNVTYADLDMVQLCKAPKRPAPKAEEASSEYASVQVQQK